MFKKMLCRIAAGMLLASCSTERMSEVDYIPVKTGDKWGYVSRDGKYLINPQFDVADVFIGNLAAVKLGEKYGYIDRNGRLLNGSLFKNVTTFSEGKAWVVKDGGVPTLIDTDGNILLEMKNVNIVHSFFEGLACVGTSNEESGEIRYGYINEKGEWVINPQFNFAERFSEGMAAVGFPSQDGESILKGYINKKGKVVIPCQFTAAEDFTSNGTAIVALREKDGYKFTYGLIDKNGKYLINPQFGYLDADGDLYRCRFADADKYGWCDENGKIVINPQFEFATGFFNSELAPISLDSKMFGYADKTGKITINPQFDFCLPFVDGMAFVFSNKKVGFIEEEGKYTVNPQFDDVNVRIISAYHYGTAGDDFVESDFFDTEAIAAKVAEMTKEGGMYGYSPDMTLGRIMERCGKDSTFISTSPDTDISLVDDMEWTRYASLEMFMRGDFYTEVSDGWWDYIKKLDTSKKPSALICRISLTDEKAKHGSQLFESIKKALGAKNEGKDKASAKRNGTNIRIEREDGTIKMTLTR